MHLLFISLFFIINLSSLSITLSSYSSMIYSSYLFFLAITNSFIIYSSFFSYSSIQLTSHMHYSIILLIYLSFIFFTYHFIHHIHPLPIHHSTTNSSHSPLIHLIHPLSPPFVPLHVLEVPPLGRAVGVALAQGKGVGIVLGWEVEAPARLLLRHLSGEARISSLAGRSGDGLVDWMVERWTEWVIDALVELLKDSLVDGLVGR